MKKLFFIFILFSSQSSWSDNLNGLHLICEQINRKNLDQNYGIEGYSFGESRFDRSLIYADGTKARVVTEVSERYFYFTRLKNVDLKGFTAETDATIDRETLVLTRNESKYQCKVVEETNYSSTMYKHLDIYQKRINKLTEKNQI